ncbi:MAG TPA: hypothetical protein DIS79_04840 [Bacteroidetes bacterium]|nr:hypothetical protein [Bacteroidota bacterium]HRK05825.1 PAS domain S-box protein [Chlorobiota bacterium]
MRRLAIRLAVLYVLVSAAYIIISDAIVAGVGDALSPEDIVTVEVVKGLLFVLVSGVVFAIVGLQYARSAEKSESNFALVFAEHPDPMMIYDVETWRLLETNAAAHEKYGYSGEEFRALTVPELHPPQDREPTATFLKDHRPLRAESSSIVRHRGKDGRIFWVSIRSRDVKLNGRKVRICSITDLSDLTSARRDIEAMTAEEQRILVMLKVVAESIEDGFYTLDRSLTITHANKTFIDFLGMSGKDAIGRNWLELFPEARDSEPHLRIVAALEERRTTSVDTYDPRIDTWYRVLVYPFEGGVAVFYRDVSLEKKNELALRHEKENLSTLINNSDEVIYSIDTQHRLLVGNTAYLENMERLIGRRPVPGEDARSFLFGEAFTSRWADWFQQAVNGQRVDQEFDLDVPVVGKRILNAAFNPIIVDGQTVGVAIRVSDVTTARTHERRLREQAAQLSEVVERYEKLNQATNDAVWDWSMRDDSVFWNHGINTLFGYDVGRTPLSWWSDRVHPDDREEVLDHLTQWSVTGRSMWRHEYRFLCADGSYRWVLDRGSAIYDEQGTPIRMIGAMQDITASRLYLERIEEINVRLREIAQIASHELRGPLATVLSLLNLFNKESIEDPENTRIIGMIETSATDVDAVIHRIVQRTAELERDL